ncbi:MAG: hypothetical protein LBQ44_05525 [Treponema sp.]|jgi:hypothetical protein|nr:hypothetical protein [Treponema sp.]
MFFSKQKKKGETAGNAAAKRMPRYDSLATIRINGFDGKALLKNISNTGFCMQSRTFAALTPGEKYIIKITPEEATGIGTFDAEVEVRWIRSEVSKFDAGFLLTKPLTGMELDRYVDYHMALGTMQKAQRLDTAS